MASFWWRVVVATSERAVRADRSSAYNAGGESNHDRQRVGGGSDLAWSVLASVVAGGVGRRGVVGRVPFSAVPSYRQMASVWAGGKVDGAYAAKCP